MHTCPAPQAGEQVSLAQKPETQLKPEGHAAVDPQATARQWPDVQVSPVGQTGEQVEGDVPPGLEQPTRRAIREPYASVWPIAASLGAERGGSQPQRRC